MSDLRHFYTHIRSHGFNHKPLFIFSLMLFFWALFDGIISYTTPVLISERTSTATMGMIIAFSSVAGAIFDFILSKFLTTIHYRRLFFIFFLLCFAYPLILFKATTILMFLIAMAVWGLYYDLQNFGTFDFISRSTDKAQYSSHFGIVMVFKSLGYLLGPLVAGFLVLGMFSWQLPAVLWIFLGISFLFYLVLVFKTPVNSSLNKPHHKLPSLSVLKEMFLWKKLGRVLLPVLIFTCLILTYDAFFWTLGPLFASSPTQFNPFLSSLFMTAYSLPPLLVGWWVGPVVRKIGSKKRTAFLTFLLSSLVLSLLIFTRSPFLIIGIVFLSSLLSSLAWPAINSAYADYISEAPQYEKEIEALEDFFVNMGYIVGPFLAGILASVFGYRGSFFVFSLIGVGVSLILLFISPKKIDIKLE